MGTTDGLGDRMRTAAFAELQAVQAFAWAADHFDDVPAELRTAWRALVPDEQRHLDAILGRMVELALAVDARPVSAGLWQALVGCASGRDFGLLIASAEERGRQSAIRLAGYLGTRDPTTATVFATIADEERAHVALASQYLGRAPV